MVLFSFINKRQNSIFYIKVTKYVNNYSNNIFDNIFTNNSERRKLSIHSEQRSLREFTVQRFKRFSCRNMIILLPFFYKVCYSNMIKTDRDVSTYVKKYQGIYTSIFYSEIMLMFIYNYVQLFRVSLICTLLFILLKNSEKSA